MMINSSDYTSAPTFALVSRASEEPVLDDMDTDRLVDRLRAGDQEALDRLVAGHLRVAVDEAIRNRRRGARQDTLMREGTRALVEEASQYDPDRHGPFPGWARRTVRRAISSFLPS